MFQDHHSEVIGFPSQSYNKREIAESGSQTTEKNVTESATQVIQINTKETQTASDGGSHEYDINDLARFLQGVESLIEYELLIPIEWDSNKYLDDEETSMQKLIYLGSPLKRIEKRVSSMSWNSRGGTLAVGYSVVRHESSCNYDSCVAVFTVSDRPTPPTIYHTSTCVMSVHFHPTNPSMLLIGLFTGDVMVWDLSREDNWISQEKSAEHSGHIKHVAWISQNIISVGSDGCIILRKHNNHIRAISTIHRFQITLGHVKKNEANNEQRVEISAFCAISDEECVLGVAGGGLLHCHLSSDTPQQGQHPVTHTYQHQDGLVTAIKYTAHFQVFAAASAPGHIRIFKIREIEPKWVMCMRDCIMDLFWTGKPWLLGVCGWDNSVQFVKVPKGEFLAYKIELRGNEVAAAEPSPNRRMLAIGTTTGAVEVWQIIF